ncbi:hypothetical protein MTO98_01570 [Mucilaginibacter sp. SMC90]|uniref:hypothetical protein n=1 Tax=Mucilaginibacter sp. SMC90 TaxID=2929803 RepID=UPI001FB47D84|nr:hypothetical protein [Mucilaginibacter sp. SMC90]UOE49760.1 hypothetical protein MTO98_01570 [Mucilaginibacter sp. SMC90]
MKNYRLYLLFVFMSLCIQAKAQYLRDYTGRPYYLKTNDGTQGSALLTDNWLNGTVNFANGKTANAILNYNIYGDELLFKSPQDSSIQAFVDPIKSFSLKDASIEACDITDVSFSSGFPAVDEQTAKTFYLVVGEGKTKLLKCYKKKVIESKDFSSQITTKTFTTTNSYYLFANNQMTKVKPSQKAMLVAMNDKADKIQEYVKANKVDFKSDVALAKLFSYYNSL